MLKWLSVITLLALAAGVAAGAWAAATGNPDVIAFATQVEHVGALWLNLLRMTVIPLVFSLLVTGVASVADAASSGRVAARAILVFGVLLVSATTFACLIFPLLLSLVPVDPTAAAGFIARASGETVAAAAPPTIGEWLAALA